MLFRRIQEGDNVSEEKRKSIGAIVNHIKEYSIDTIKFGLNPTYLFSEDQTLTKVQQISKSRDDKNYMAQYNYLVLHFTAVACRRFLD